ncbi:heme exporter protein CcmD [Oryzibacter oryziterrae]|uniref:heme exporter protein CcmD n=1 Tax=Oryzibacter oryziterrae TaxID=2766474 RepID=UPI001EFFC540|nr:heme exporter protein CcmD [Oryzibacter oryziterrae]
MIDTLGPYAGFILASYAATAGVVLALIVWIIVDHARLSRQLSSLEQRGIRRRSARSAATLTERTDTP